MMKQEDIGLSMTEEQIGAVLAVCSHLLVEDDSESSRYAPCGRLQYH